jgi:hypothetical protein
VGEGGAIAVGNTQTVITGSTFTANAAGGGTADCSAGIGGAIYSLTALELDDDIFTGNKATGDATGSGGAIAGLAQVSGSNDTFTSNVAAGSGSTCASSGAGIGGGVYGGTIVTLQSGTFNKNEATGNTIGAGGAILTVSLGVVNDTFSNNTVMATGTQGATSSSGGGAIYTQDLNASGNIFTGNRATVEGAMAASSYGGAIFSDNGTVTLANNQFKSNVSRTLSVGQAIGGAIGTTTSTLVSSGDTFVSNAATSGATGTSVGGAMYEDGASTIGHDTFTGNSTTSGMAAVGGAVGLDGSSMMVGDTFSSNVATASGAAAEGVGGALVDSGGVTLSNSVMTGNTAGTAAGAMAAGNGDFIFNTTMTGNKALLVNETDTGGGAIDTDAGITIEGSTIAGNTATLKNVAHTGGGGIFVDSGPLELATSSITGNKVLGSAPASGGGGIFLNNGASISNSTIGGNSSTTAGGGLYAGANDSVDAVNTTFYKNTAKTKGGNLENLFTVEIQNSIFAGGIGATGADINNQGTLTSDDYNIVQSDVSGTPMSGTTTHNLKADPKLLALSNNGGATFTYADQKTSPGKQYIPYAGSCGGAMIISDQRNYKRGAGGKCDVGAYELFGVPTALELIASATPALPATVGVARRNGSHHVARFWRRLGHLSAAQLSASRLFAVVHSFI